EGWVWPAPPSALPPARRAQCPPARGAGVVAGRAAARAPPAGFAGLGRIGPAPPLDARGSAPRGPDHDPRHDTRPERIEQRIPKRRTLGPVHGDPDSK